VGSARATIAAGAAAAAGAGLLLTGRIDGSVITALALVLVVRAVAGVVALEPAHAARAVSRQFTTAPVWIAIVVVGSLRAGSVHLADVRGANAVAGLAIAQGEVVAVIAAWVAVVAAVLAISGGAGIGGAYRGTVAPSVPFARLDATGAVLQALLVVTLFAGPQVRGAPDVGVWVAGVVGVGAAAVLARRIARWDRADALAWLLGGAALMLALVAPRL
jgi:hypothetical protein